MDTVNFFVCTFTAKMSFETDEIDLISCFYVGHI